MIQALMACYDYNASHTRLKLAVVRKSTHTTKGPIEAASGVNVTAVETSIIGSNRMNCCIIIDPGYSGPHSYLQVGVGKNGIFHVHFSRIIVCIPVIVAFGTSHH